MGYASVSPPGYKKPRPSAKERRHAHRVIAIFGWFKMPPPSNYWRMSLDEAYDYAIHQERANARIRIMMHERAKWRA